MKKREILMYFRFKRTGNLFVSGDVKIEFYNGNSKVLFLWKTTQKSTKKKSFEALTKDSCFFSYYVIFIVWLLVQSLMFWFWLNTEFIPESDVVILTKDEIDKAAKDTKHTLYAPNMRITLYFRAVGRLISTKKNKYLKSIIKEYNTNTFKLQSTLISGFRTC